jgi:hypothetical protein
MKRLLCLFLLIPVALLLAGCSKPQIAAFGSNSEIVIVTLPRCSDQASVLKSILERDIHTVQYEKAFQVRVVTSGDVRPEHNRKNVILLDYLEPESLLTGTILGLAGKDKQAMIDGTLNRKTLQDRWARGQAVILLTARNHHDLDDLLVSQSEEVFRYVNDAVQTRLNRSLFYAGEQTAATERLAETYGWSLRLPTGYKIDETYASQRLVKIIKDKPARMITVYWEGGDWDDMAATCLERKKMFAWEFWDQDEVVEDGLTTSRGRFVGHDGIVMTGMWENKKYTIGGVFVTYCFGCEQCDRNFVVDGSVFAPGLEKLPLMRELNAILATFKCCEQE